MKSGYFIHFSAHYKLAWFWCVIIFSFRQILFYEADKHGNWFLTLLQFFALFIFLYLVWPRRFLFFDNDFYFTKIFNTKMVKIELNYMTAIYFDHFSFEFSYAGKHYRFITIGHAQQLLKEKFHETINEKPVTK